MGEAFEEVDEGSWAEAQIAAAIAGDIVTAEPATTEPPFEAFEEVPPEEISLEGASIKTWKWSKARKDFVSEITLLPVKCSLLLWSSFIHSLTGMGGGIKLV